MTSITPAQRQYLRGLAHNLNPVVMIGQHGLSPAVIKETEAALKAHELIKVRVLGDDREARLAWYAELSAAVGAIQVQHIGKLLVLFRPNEDSRINLPR